jgi:hypothetical protein
MATYQHFFTSSQARKNTRLGSFASGSIMPPSMALNGITPMMKLATVKTSTFNSVIFRGDYRVVALGLPFAAWKPLLIVLVISFADRPAWFPAWVGASRAKC